jgi:ATP-dependent DNA ligase
MALRRWIDPFLVVRIDFSEWTPENQLRHPRFAGIGSDKDPREVMREDDRFAITLAEAWPQTRPR